MKDKRKIVLCCILMMSAVFVLFIGVDAKQQDRQRVVTINKQEYTFQYEDIQKAEMKVMLDSYTDEVIVRLPLENSDEAWAINREIHPLNYRADNELYHEYRFVVTSHDLREVSFKKINWDEMIDTDYDELESYELTILFEYNDDQEYSNVFYHHLIEVQEPIYDKENSCIEIPLTTTKENYQKIQDHKYAKDYLVDIKFIYNIDNETSRFHLNIEKCDGTTDFSVRCSVNEMDASKIVESIQKANAGIEIDMNPIQNSNETYAAFYDVKKMK